MAKIHVDDGLGLTVHKTFDGRPNFLGDLTGRPNVNDSLTPLTVTVVYMWLRIRLWFDESISAFHYKLKLLDSTCTRVIYIMQLASVTVHGCRDFQVIQ